jgi:hypothetical protein
MAKKFVYFVAGTVVTDMGATRSCRNIIDLDNKILTEEDLCAVEYDQGKNFYGQRMTIHTMTFLHEIDQ